MVKPVGSLCNLDCHYCYYLDKADIYGRVEPAMSDELLEMYVKQYIECNSAETVMFSWHGGEPLIAGLDYYRRAVEYQKKYAGDKKIENNLQTNGILVNREWCRFFRDNDFLIGVSLDGPQDIHDPFRVDKGGRPTFERVMQAVEMMAAEGVEFNTLTTVNKLSAGRGAEVYRFFKSLGSKYMQFLPVLEYVKDVPEGKRPVIVPPGTEGSRLAEWSVTPEGYGRFMTDVFDCWIIGDVGRYYVQLFDVLLGQWAGVPASLCSFSETCGDNLVVEHNGDIYFCDHFVYPQHRIGNINETTLLEALKSRQHFAFGLDKRNSLPRECRACQWYFACCGECPKHRFDPAKTGDGMKNALCDGYKMIFRHVEPYMKYMAELLAKRQPPALVMQFARQRLGIM